jgi:hypothetical protein
MAVTLTYDSQLSRVRIDATGLGSALTADVERSTDQVTWSTVRGGLDRPVTSGVIATVDDYEFAPDVVNYYRVRYLDTVTFVSAGTAAHAANASVAPGLPAGRAAGDALLILAATRASAQGTPTPAPTGYTELVNAGNVRVHAKTAGSSESTPTVGFTGAGGATMSVSAQMCAFRGAQAVLGATPAAVLNGVAQDMATLAYTPVVDNSVLVWVGWKQDDWTSTTRPAGVPADIGSSSTTLGDDQGIAWAYQIQTVKTAVGASSFTVTGGAAAVSRGIVFELLANETTQSNSITPSLGGRTWLKFLHRPFLNTEVTPFGEVNVTRRTRSGTFDVVGRSFPVSVTDLKGSRQFTLQLKTLTTEDHDRLDLVLAGGDPVFLHCPPGSRLPTLYADIGDVSDDSPVPATHFFTLPLTETAPPGPDVVGSTATYQTIVNNYLTYTAVLSAFADYAEILDEVGQPGDIVVP